MKYKDIFGKAIIDYYNHLQSKSENSLAYILTWTNISDVDELPLSYLFRTYEDMPILEQIALKRCHGKILDVGCGAGSHSLYLQRNGHHVKSIDISKGAVDISKKRGVDHVQQKDILDVKETFDTILLLMNGTGIFQEYDKAKTYLKHLKSILNPNAQILIDSSDIKYMFEDEMDIHSSNRYYGGLDYFISYKGEEETPMKWLYMDFESLKQQCLEVGLDCEIVMQGEHFDYLAKISKMHD